MTNAQTGKVPVWFWIVGVIALLWNVMGVFAYIKEMTISPEALAALTAAEQALYADYPVWAAGAFAVAVFAGAAGCVLLLLRNELAVPTFWLSAAGIAVQMFHSFFISNALAVYGPSAVIMPIFIILIGAGLVWWSAAMKARGWLK
jgi:hypothetical protein